MGAISALQSALGHKSVRQGFFTTYIKKIKVTFIRDSMLATCEGFKKH